MQLAQVEASAATSEGKSVSSIAREKKTKRAQWLRFTLNRGRYQHQAYTHLIPLRCSDVRIRQTKIENSDYHNHRDAPPAAAQQAEVARDYLKRTARIDELNGHPPG